MGKQYLPRRDDTPRVFEMSSLCLRTAMVWGLLLVFAASANAVAPFAANSASDTDLFRTNI